ncbi:DUF3883 domain-containing protein [Flavobacterium piscis]|uniref:Protein NO VEIN C-terminal domain-containing protein n=1 Tax=Flavobacterium piscis TaxID=1114874 RepID=A0ABU1Y3L8_9FLAO|nr:DUF3883 domain-containing protein [Flavobacterium piscis]MDR7208824.1 hypothetical protein [Flavobacterium piscis]
MSKKEFIEQLHGMRSDFKHDSQARSITKLLDIVSADIYSESQRFFYELIQNADDSASSDKNTVYIDFRENALIVSHDGDSFSEDDIDSITDAGASTKTSKKATTGYKGIGFKSVFGRSRRVSIFSDGYQFRFDKAVVKDGYPWQTIPIWTEINELPRNLQDVISTLKHSVITVIEMESVFDLKASLEGLLGEGEILLFLRRVNQIIISYDGNAVTVLEKSVDTKSTLSKKVTLLKNGKTLSNWLVRTFSDIDVPSKVSLALADDDKVPEKLKSATHSEITFAAVLNDDKIDTPARDQRLIYTFLPTKVKEYDFPYLVNGNFLTNSPRESIHQDNPWNIWLFETIAHLNISWLEELASTSYKFQLLKLLGNKFSTGTNQLKNAFNDGFNSSAIKGRFLASYNGDILSPDETLYDKTSLSEQAFIEKNIIIKYLENEKKILFKDNCFLHPEMELKSKLSQLEVTEFSLENITEFFKSRQFLDSHKIKDNFELIKFLKQKSDQDQTGVLLDELRSLPFVFDQDNILRNPSDGICFPAGDGINRFEMGDVPVIANEIYKFINQEKSIHDWFLKLGTQTPSESAYITNIILPQLGNDNFITIANYVSITVYLVKMFKQGILDDEMLARMRILKLKTGEDELSFEQAQKCYLSKNYNPKVNLEDIVSLTFVSEQYLQIGISITDMYLFFKALSVKDSIEIETITSNCTLSSIEVISSANWVNETKDIGRQLAERKGGFGFASSNLIYGVKIPSFLHATASNYDYSKIFWKHMLDDSSLARELAVDAVFYYGTGNGKNRYQVPVKNYFHYFVANNACIPTSLGTLEKSEDVYISIKEIRDIAGEYFPVLEYDDNITADWSVYFNFKKKLEVEDYLTILDKIAIKSQSPTKKDIKNIGRVYSKLCMLLPNLASDERSKIKKWGEKARLLTIGDTYEPTSELKRITKEGFSKVSVLKILLIPSNCDKEDLGSLLDLFGVLTVREFIPQYENLRDDDTLKDRFEKILPYLALISQKKSLEESDEFDRLYSLLDNMSFGTASTIYLSFKNGEEYIKGPLVKVFREPDKINFQGKWNSERILLELLDELKKYLIFPGTNEEFRFLLLEPDFAEIESWLKENDINISTIKSIRKFNKQQILTPEIESIKVNSLVTVTDDFVDEEQHNTAMYVPNWVATDFDYSKITFKESNSDRDPETDEIQTETEVVYKEMGDEGLRKGHGRWAEEFVNGLLKQNYPEAKINWMNEETESYMPYDFMVDNEGDQLFIEVKGTPSLTKDLVYLSEQEWKFMLSKNEKYLFYRVYGTGTSEPEVKILENPAQKVRSGNLVPYKPCIEI